MFKRIALILSIWGILCTPSYGWEIGDIKIPWFSREESDRFAVIWEDSMGLLEKALTRLDLREELPDEKFIGNDRRKNDQKIDEILMEVVEIMSDSDVKDVESNIVKVRKELTESRRSLAQLREREIVASEKGSFFDDSRDDLKKKIEDRIKLISDEEERLIRLETELVGVFKSTGVNASEDQIKGLLSGVTAGDIIGMYGVYQNMRLFSDQLEDLMASNSQDLNIARRYYGIYALLIKTSAVMNDRFASKVNDKYIVDLDEMSSKAHSLKGDIESQLDMGGLSVDQRRSLLSNLESSNMTLKVISDYRSYLEYQRDQALERSKKLTLDYSVAYNAYRTMKLAKGFLDLVRSSKSDLAAIDSIEIPQIASFSNESLKREFQEITESLR